MVVMKTPRQTAPQRKVRMVRKTSSIYANAGSYQNTKLQVLGAGMLDSGGMGGGGE